VFDFFVVVSLSNIYFSVFVVAATDVRLQITDTFETVALYRVLVIHITFSCSQLIMDHVTASTCTSSGK